MSSASESAPAPRAATRDSQTRSDVGGSGSGVTRYDSAEQLAEHVAAGATPEGIDGVTLVQDYVPARDARVIRCETLNGRFLYAIALNGAGSTFDLCPADVCMVWSSREIIRSVAWRRQASRMASKSASRSLKCQ